MWKPTFHLLSNVIYYIWKHGYFSCKNMQSVMFLLISMFPMFPTFIVLASQTIDNIYFETFQSLQLMSIVLVEKKMMKKKESHQKTIETNMKYWMERKLD